MGELKCAINKIKQKWKVNKKDYLILKYEDINTEPEIFLKKLLLLYNYDIWSRKHTFKLLCRFRFIAVLFAIESLATLLLLMNRFRISEIWSE